MAGDFRGLKRELSRRESGRGKRYPAELRARVVTWAQQRRAVGAAWPVIADELGVRLETVRRWCLASQRGSAPRALVPVRVVARPAARPATVVSLSGWRIDGLTVAEAAEMLRALG